jgi:hypothetical protein
MANTGFKGVDVRQTGAELVFRAFLQTSAGAVVTTGTTNLYLMELQSDGTIKTYDFNDNTFKTTAVTTEPLAMTYRKSNNATTDTGLWTVVLSTLTGFTIGAVYLVRINNTNAFPTDQMREFQYGSEQGDLVVDSSGNLASNALKINNVATTPVTTIGANIGTTQPVNFTGTAGSALVQSDTRDFLGHAVILDANNYPGVNIVDIGGSVSQGAAGYMGIDWSKISGPGSAVSLSATTISTSQTVASVTGNVGGNVAGSVGSVAGNVGGNVAGSVGWIAGVIFPLNFGDLCIDPSGNLCGSVASVDMPVSIYMGQPLSAPRALDTVDDNHLLVGDALHCAIAGTAGKKDISSGTGYTVATPFTGTLLRSYVVTSGPPPPTLPTKLM